MELCEVPMMQLSMCSLNYPLENSIRFPYTKFQKIGVLQNIARIGIVKSYSKSIYMRIVDNLHRVSSLYI